MIRVPVMLVPPAVTLKMTTATTMSTETRTTSVLCPRMNRKMLIIFEANSNPSWQLSRQGSTPMRNSVLKRKSSKRIDILFKQGLSKGLHPG